ncbi:MAG TPA: NUDIX hydrolase [Gemmataceae bacterium]|nr:NUDIX hydrolase [Gemmataceae bacterium]
MTSTPLWIRQAAAIPVKGGQVCLVTSSSGKRWVVPKGIIDPGKTAGEIALQEAWEEAGLVGLLHPEPVGSYLYAKYGGTCHVIVFLLEVTEAARDWPERALRQRDWLSPAQAARQIEDVGLRRLIRACVGNGRRMIAPPRE